jgi:maltose 6'-phosphate phosphatase
MRRVHWRASQNRNENRLKSSTPLSSPEPAMESKVLTLNLHTYQQHHGDLWHVLQEHGREVYLIAEAIVRENIDVICFQEVGEHFHDRITHPYGFSESNMAFRIQKKIHELSGRHFHLFQDWSHIGFGCWREGTAILSRYQMHHCDSPWVTWNKDTSHIASRRITMCYLEIPWFGGLHIVNAHMNCLEMGFKADFDYLKQLIYWRDRHHLRGTLLIGDFNVPAGEEAYQHIVWSGEFIDQWHESNPCSFYEPTHQERINGWEHRNGARRIDFMFKHSRSSLRINEMRLIFNGHFYPIVSDHFGCIARFHLHPF